MNSRAIRLSKRERLLLDEWEQAGKRAVTLRDIADAVSEPAARMAASTLVRKGLLDRIRPGLYAVRPIKSIARPWTLPTLVAVEFLLSERRHYVGGFTAFTLHRLTPPQHTSIVDVFIPEFLRSRYLGNSRVIFHRRRPGAFDGGIIQMPIDGTPVAVSDPERTVLDGLDEPHVLGGMEEAIRLFNRALPQVDPARLAHQALNGARDSTCQRLGLLLERAGASGAFMEALRARAAASTGVHLLLPGAPDSAPVHPAWRVVENDVLWRTVRQAPANGDGRISEGDFTLRPTVVAAAGSG